MCPYDVQSNAVIEVFASPVKEFIDTTLPEALVLLESSTPRLPHLFSLVHDWEEGLTSNLAFTINSEAKTGMMRRG